MKSSVKLLHKITSIELSGVTSEQPIDIIIMHLCGNCAEANSTDLLIKIALDDRWPFGHNWAERYEIRLGSVYR